MKLATKYIFLIIVLLGTISITNGQSLEEIIQKHTEAHGDIEKWEKVNSMKITGKFTAFSEEDDFYSIKTKDGKYYSELALGQHEVIEAFNGETGWTIDPWQEILFPRELNKNERTVFQQKAEFFTPFYNYKERGYEVEYIGEENVDGIDTYVIRITRPDGFKEKWFLDTNTFLEYKVMSRWVDFAYGVPSECYFDDFRDFDGIIIPCYIERTFWQRDRVLIIEDIEFNIDIDSSLFEVPKSAEIKKLNFLIGQWDVAVNAWSARANRWYNVDSTTSNIDYEATNLIQEKISFSNVFVQSSISNFSYNSTDNNYRITTYDVFSSNTELFKGMLTDSSFVIENIAIGCDTITGINSRATYSNVNDKGFELEISQSNDNGKSWSSTIKMKYTKED